jgi:hypothetical protein
VTRQAVAALDLLDVAAAKSKLEAVEQALCRQARVLQRHGVTQAEAAMSWEITDRQFTDLLLVVEVRAHVEKRPTGLCGVGAVRWTEGTETGPGCQT